MKEKKRITPPSKEENLPQTLDGEISELSKAFFLAQHDCWEKRSKLALLSSYKEALNNANKMFGIDKNTLDNAYKDRKHALANRFNNAVRTRQEAKVSFGLSGALSAITIIPALVAQGAEIFIAAAPATFAAFMAFAGIKKMRDSYLLTKEVKNEALEFKKQAALPAP